jgi:hypothetical protein
LILALGHMLQLSHYFPMWQRFIFGEVIAPPVEPCVMEIYE